MTDPIIQNINTVQERIRKACLKAGRSVESVKLLLATKTIPAERIKIALHTGQTLIAENRVQELKEKYDELRDISHTNHFIGHLQTNKVKEVLKYNITCIQSLDRFDLAEKLHQRLSSENKSIDVLIQVNTSYEESKFGVHPDNVIELVRQIAIFETIKIKGLMTIGLFSAEAEKIRRCFRLLKNIQTAIAALNIANVEMKELSMGMSGDLEIAIEEGATILRIGTAIFGSRPTPDSYYWNESAPVTE